VIGAAHDEPAKGWVPQPVIDWLYLEGRLIADPNELTGALAERLVAAGAPIVRLRLALRTLHPLMAAWLATWEAGRLERDEVALHGLEQRASYLGSPLEQVERSGRSFRRRLEARLGERDHPLLHALAARGATDDLALPVSFVSGQKAGLVAVTDRPGGLSDQDLHKLEALGVALTPIIEAMAARHLAETLATAYIGPRSGLKVLQGQIKRGDVESLRPAIWFSDLLAHIPRNCGAPAEIA